MGDINQKECISINFRKGLGIFGNHFRYPMIYEQETYNCPTGKVVDIQGIQAHAWKFQNRYKNSIGFASSATPPELLWGARVQRPTEHYMGDTSSSTMDCPLLGLLFGCTAPMTGR